MTSQESGRESRDEAIEVELLHVALRQTGLHLGQVLDLERQLFQKDLVDVMLLGHVPSIAMEPKEDDGTVWTAYGRLTKREFPNVSPAKKG
jgi:hypothetical protein